MAVHTEGVTGSIPVASTILFNDLEFSPLSRPQFEPQKRLSLVGSSGAAGCTPWRRWTKALTGPGNTAFCGHCGAAIYSCRGDDPPFYWLRTGAIRQRVAGALKDVYRAIDAPAAEVALSAFEASDWGQKYPAIGMSWRRVWNEVIPFFAFPKDVRRLIYTTNAIEALNSKLRRAVRARGHFPTDEAALKLLFLVLNRSEKEWTMPPREWHMAKAQFAVLFGERFIRAAAWPAPLG